MNDYRLPDSLEFPVKHILRMRGLKCSCPISPAKVQGILESPGEVEAVSVSLNFSVGKNEILVTGKVKGKTRLCCSRCLKDFHNYFESEFEEIYPTTAEIIDIMIKIREALVLENGIRHLCRPDCKGLCHVCGADLNLKKCSCRSDKPSPFEALKDLKKKKEQDNAQS